MKKKMPKMNCLQFAAKSALCSLAYKEIHFQKFSLTGVPLSFYADSEKQTVNNMLLFFVHLCAFPLSVPLYFLLHC